MITVPAEDIARLLTALRDQYEGSVDGLLAAAQRGQRGWWVRSNGEICA